MESWSDVAVVALFAFFGSATVAVLGAVATIYGPAYQSRSQREAEKDAADANLRYQRAVDLAEALTAIDGPWSTGSDLNSRQRSAHIHWMRFVATLRPGEGDVSRWTREALLAIERGGRSDLALSDLVALAVFGWLRGDIPVGEFKNLNEAFE